MTAENGKDEQSRPPRLHRLERLFARYPSYFITACTAGRRSLLANTETHTAFVKFAAAGPQHGAWIGAYVLMPDHLHFFVAVDDERLLLSAFMKSLKNALSKALRAKGVSSPHWQKGFFDHLLRSSESYSAKWAYVAANPVRAGLVLRAEDWVFQGEVHPLEVRRS